MTKHTVQVLRAWLAEHPGDHTSPLFPTHRGSALSRDAVAHLVTKHAARAASRITKHVTPHTLRHSAAMSLLHAGVDISVIALWMGHESTKATQMYLHADMALKERALARTTPATSATGRYQAPDHLIAFLDSL